MPALIPAPGVFAPLPRMCTERGTPRHIGVEIELAGLEEAHLAALLQRRLGGQALCLGEQDWELRGSRLGRLQIYLDFAARKHLQGPIKDIGLRLGREVIPVEIVTEPLEFKQFRALDGVLDMLRRAGALGTEASLLYGFGLHLNIEAVSPREVVRSLLAYALIEPWMRRYHPIELTRATLPFADRYPERLVRALIDLGPQAPIERVIAAYCAATMSRNHGLDMLPLFAALRPDLVDLQAVRGGTVSPRPAFHFRLPDCRISDPQWSLDTEWRRWRLVETVAARPGLLRRLGRSWGQAHGAAGGLGFGWPARCEEILRGAGLA